MVFANKLSLQEMPAIVQLKNLVDLMEFVLRLVKFLTSFLLEKQKYRSLSLLDLHQVFVLLDTQPTRQTGPITV